MIKKRKKTKKERMVVVPVDPNRSFTGTTGPGGYIFWAPTSPKSFVQTTLDYLKGWFR